MALFNSPATGERAAAFSELYLIGNDISATFDFAAIGLSRTADINPVGRKIRPRDDYEANKFNPSRDYEVSNGLLVPKYQKINFHRLGLGWRECHHLPRLGHNLCAFLPGGSVWRRPS